MKAIRFLTSENPHHTIMLYLRRLRSERLCEKIIRKKYAEAGRHATDDLIKKKSIGLAASIDSALGHLETNAENLNSRILSRYYAILQLTIAEQISSTTSEETLADIQRQTEKGGHGLFVLRDEALDFPNGYYVGVTQSGYFYCYSKFLGLKSKLWPFAQPRKPSAIQDVQDRSALVSMTDLLRRVPELCEVIKEHLDTSPLTFNVFHIESDPKDPRQGLPRLRSSMAPEAPTELTSTVGISPSTKESRSEEDVSLILKYPIDGIFDFEREVSPRNPKDIYIKGKIKHPVDKYWFDVIPLYQSPYQGKTYVVPFWGGIQHPYHVHFLTLYGLSIVVRYLPDLWSRISSKECDHVYSLLEFYLDYVDNILPSEGLERIVGYKTLVQPPGGFNSPI